MSREIGERESCSPEADKPRSGGSEAQNHRNKGDELNVNYANPLDEIRRISKPGIGTLAERSGGACEIQGGVGFKLEDFSAVKSPLKKF